MDELPDESPLQLIQVGRYHHVLVDHRARVVRTGSTGTAGDLLAVSNAELLNALTECERVASAWAGRGYTHRRCERGSAPAPIGSDGP